MSQTIKQIADELGVSKPTIAKVITDLDIEPHKVSNRFYLSDEDCDSIRTKILKNIDIPKSQKSKKSKSGEMQKSQKSQSEIEKSLIPLLETQISFLQEQIAAKDMQLSIKDEQIKGQQLQMEQLTAALQKQTAAMESTTTALIAAQTLHAADKKTLMLIEDEKNERKLSFWERRFTRKSEKKVKKKHL